MSDAIAKETVLGGFSERRAVGGDVIYQEGDESDAVYIVDGGEVEVERKDPKGKSVLLSILHRGQIFGEMGVIRNTARSTTVRARGHVKLMAIGRADFLAAFGGGNPIALPLLRMLCDRLSDANGQIYSDAKMQPGAPVAEIDRIQLIPLTHSAINQIGSDGIVIGALPYCVGRKALAGEPPVDHSAQLRLGTKDPYEIAREHFVIEALDGLLVARDLGTHFGTIVNGVRIATFEHSTAVGLGFGKNLVQPGGVDSAFQFTVMVDPR